MKDVFLLCIMCFMALGCQDSPEESGPKQAHVAWPDSLAASLDAISDSSDMPGFGVAIVQDDELLYLGGFGFADLANDIPYTENTVQPIASVSKTFIGLS